MDTPMIRPSLVFPLVAAMSAPALFGQTAPPNSFQEIWIPLLAVSSDSIDLRYSLEPTPTGWQVQFKNFSAIPLHFGFYLDGIQAIESVTENGRIHLPPSKVAAPLIPWSGDGSSRPPIIKLMNIRSGEDEGPFLGD